jgi:glucosamine--fructose-6-phosphate aminotransferase (isomerizing)
LLQLSNILLNVIKGNYVECSDVVGFSYTCLGVSSPDMVWVEPSKTINYLNITQDDYVDLFSLNVDDFVGSVSSVMGMFESISQLHLIGKGYDYVTSKEGALKIKEVSYIFTDAYPCGELKHGTLSLIEEGSMVLSIITSGGVLLDKSKNAMHEISARGGKCIVISQFDEVVLGADNHIVSLPCLHELLMPIVAIIPIDIIAYQISTGRGINPDKPRNLAKSVTVE